MKFRLEIETDNAAFSEWREDEIATILEDAARSLRTYGLRHGDKRTLHDTNGNSVGHYSLGAVRS